MEMEFEQSNGNGSTTYLTHNFHTYPAKFIPQIPKSTILQFTKEGDTVLDPFCGCGTTLVEAKLLNRNSIGVDLNPIAVLVSKAKTNKLSDLDITIVEKILNKIKLDVTSYYDNKKVNINYNIPEFNNRDHWFQQNVLHELGIIKAHIQDVNKKELREFLATALSSIVVTVSNQESDTRFAAIDKQIKPFRTFFELKKKLEGMKKVIFIWNKFNGLKEFDKLPELTKIGDLTSLDEDLVTYITIHNILIPNEFKVLAASYPGAQADRVVLVEPGTGRKQKRKYIDIISYLPDKNITAMQENKGEYSKSSIQKEITEISKYNTDKNYKEALKTFQRRFEESSVDSVLKIGVGFWSSPKFSLATIKELDLRNLDYYVYISRDMKKWSIWRTGDIDIFKKNEGEVKLPNIKEIGGSQTAKLEGGF